MEIRNKSWFKVFRGIKDWEWWGDHKATTLWLYLLMTANYEASACRGKKLNRGQLLTGRKKLSLECNLSEKEVRNILAKFKKSGQITVSSTNKFSVITIVNYDRYQNESLAFNNPKGQQKANNEPTKGHIKEYNNLKNKEFKNKIDEEYNVLLKHKNFEIKRFKESWNSYLYFKGETFNAQSKLLILKKILEHSVDDSIKAISLAIESGWNTVYFDSVSNNQKRPFKTAAEKRKEAIEQVRRELENETTNIISLKKV